MRWAIVVIIVISMLGRVLAAEELELPESREDSVIGELYYTRPGSDETLLDIARTFDFGYDQIVLANPTINRWVPSVIDRILLPSRYILPDAKREGIVINLAELRLYYYPPLSSVVLTYPISTGKMDWKTPLGKTSVIRKEKDPGWAPPKTIREEREREGEFVPDYIPGGAENNPMGAFALRLGVKGYFIHGTDEGHAFGIGMRVTHGCIRMYPEDIEELYARVTIGTPVYIVDEAVKLGWRRGRLYLEVHRPIDLEERQAMKDLSLEEVVAMTKNRAQDRVEVDEGAVQKIFNSGDGIPMSVVSGDYP